MVVVASVVVVGTVVVVDTLVVFVVASVVVASVVVVAEVMEGTLPSSPQATTQSAMMVKMMRSFLISSVTLLCSVVEVLRQQPHLDGVALLTAIIALLCHFVKHKH